VTQNGISNSTDSAHNDTNTLTFIPTIPPDFKFGDYDAMDTSTANDSDYEPVDDNLSIDINSKKRINALRTKRPKKTSALPSWNLTNSQLQKFHRLNDLYLPQIFPKRTVSTLSKSSQQQRMRREIVRKNNNKLIPSKIIDSSSNSTLRKELCFDSHQCCKQYSKVLICCGKSASDCESRSIPANHPLSDILPMYEYRLKTRVKYKPGIKDRAKNNVFKAGYIIEQTKEAEYRLSLDSTLTRPFEIQGISVCPDCFFLIHGLSDGNFVRYRKRINQIGNEISFNHGNAGRVKPKKPAAVAASYILDRHISRFGQHQPDYNAVQLPEHSIKQLYSELVEVNINSKYYFFRTLVY
jgi:hypothetical protein